MIYLAALQGFFKGLTAASDLAKDVGIIRSLDFCDLLSDEMLPKEMHQPGN